MLVTRIEVREMNEKKKQIQIEDSEIETVINNRALDRCITR